MEPSPSQYSEHELSASSVAHVPSVDAASQTPAVMSPSSQVVSPLSV